MTKPVQEVYVSSKNQLKLRAVEQGLRKAGIEAVCTGVEVETGVSEQPRSVLETINGARNRHEALRRQLARESFCVSIESGVVPKEGIEGWYGLEVVVISNADQEVIGTDYGVRYPEDMLVKVPSEYPDLGVLVQDLYGIQEKDPVVYLTKGKFTREELITTAVAKIATQL